MKNLVVILLAFLAGCANFSPITQNFPNWTQTQNQRHAYTYKENLKGATQYEILTKFGEPDEKATRKNVFEEEEEIWVYSSSLGYNRKIRAIFINEVVSAINYQ